MHRGLEAFEDICVILFLKDQDPKTESRFSPKIMQIRCKPAGLEDQDSKTESRFSPKIMQIHCKQGGLEDKDPKTEFGFSPKIMQKHSKPGSLEDQDPKSKISKINFTSWIRGFCRHLYTFVSSFLKDQDPKTESRFSPKIMQIRCKATGLEDQDPKTESRFSPKIMQINCKQEFGDVWRIRIQKLNLDFVPKSCKFAVNQVVWRIRRSQN